LILALSSSTDFFSIALFTKEKEFVSELGFFDRKIQKTALPAIHSFLSENNLSLKDLTALAVDTGPGALTGLRIGIATVKTMAYAFNLPVYEASSLELMRWNFSENQGVMAGLDGKQGRVFAQIFYENNEKSVIFDIRMEKLLEMIEKEKISHYIKIGNGFGETDEAHYPKASNFIKVFGSPKNFSQIHPNYCRKSQAEENKK